MSNDRKDRVFLSYASEDLDTVRQVYKGLKKRGLDVWFDKKHLKPGKWKPQITRAINKSRYFVIGISNAAIRKTGDEPGFQDEELNDAYEIAKNQPEQEFSIIPARLEVCHRGDHRLSLFQQYDLFPDFDKGLDKLAVDMGGESLSNPEAKDERTADQKLIAGLFAKANTEYDAGNYDSSAKLVESILTIGHDHADAWNLKGVALIAAEKHEQGIKAFNKTLEIDPDYVKAWHNKGIVLKMLGKFDEAIEAFDRALEINSDLAEALYGKGGALHKIGKHEQAILVFDKALKVKSDFAEAWGTKGLALHKLGNFEKAVQAYEKALEIKPGPARGWYHKGLALIELGRYEESLAAFNQSLEINPDDTDALKYKDGLMKQLRGNG